MSPISRKALALSLLLLVLLAAVELVAAPLWRLYRGDRETVADLRAQLERYRQLAATRDAAEQTLASLRERAGRERLTLDEPASGRAAAALQESIKQLVTTAGGRLTRTRLLPIEAQGGLNRVSAEVRIQADTQTLGPVLYALESHFPYQFLDRLSVRARTARRGQSSGTEPSIPLDVGVQVSSYLRADRAAPEAPP